MYRRLAALGALLACAAPASAQSAAGSCPPDGQPQTLRASVTGPADLVRVQLCGGVKYIAETNRGGVRLEFRPLVPGTPVPFVREGMMGRDVQGGQSWVVDVGTTGIFEVRVLGMQPGLPLDMIFTPRVDRSAEKAAKDSAKAAEKARKDAEKAEKKAREEAAKAEKKAREEAEKAAKQQAAPN